MDKLQAGHAVIEASERQIRDLIIEALAEGNYALVSKLAQAAEGLRTTAQKLAGAYAKVEILVNRETEAPGVAPVVASDIDALRRTTKEYPHFETQGDRLIKVGWSKKDRSEYEHRTDRDIASAVSLYLAEVPKDKTFKMDDLLPVEVEGNEVPLYQAYLVLAWLRDRGAIGKQGKDGYQWLVRDFDESAFETAWGSTPSRR